MGGERQSSFAERFWEKVQKTDGCWLWTGSRMHTGHGHIRIGPASEGFVLAHRASWEIHFGPIPEKLFVLHTCDCGQCVRPDHLFLGTQGDNMRDMSAKGRHWLQGRGHLVTGENNPKSRLTWPMVEAIRTALKSGASKADLAREYAVTKENIHAIAIGKTWKIAS